MTTKPFHHSLRVLLGGATALLLLVGRGGAQSAPLLAQPTFTADHFTDFVGIGGSPLRYYVIPNGPYAGAGKTYDPQVFYDLGIRYYRAGLFNDLTPADYPDQIKAAWETHGVRPMLLIDSNKTKTPEDVMAKLARFDPASIAEMEGPNEVNNKFPPQDLNIKYKGKTDEAGGAAFMNDVYGALKANPATANIPVVSYTAIFTDYHLARPYTAFDFSNMHSYQGYDVPSSSLLMNETRFNNVLPDGATIKPYVPTECGYNVQPDRSNGTGGTGSLRAQALNIPMLFAEYFRHGIRRAYLFSIENVDGYGLIENDLKTKRPSYFALQNLMATIKDADWNPQTHAWTGGDFVPRALLFGMAGAPPTVHTLTLQKHDGTYLLLLWNEVRNFDQNAHKDIINAPVPVSLTIRTPILAGATLLTQNDAGGYDTTPATVQNGALSLNVPSSVMIVRLTPRPSAALVLPPAPQAVGGTATENSIHLQWQAPPVSKPLAGYFVYRNGEFLTTTHSTSYDDSSTWIRPGLGYVYAVQSYDNAGGMSPRVAATIRTSDRRPDLVCTSVDVPTIKAGDDVVFRGTLKNIGDGATPYDTVTGLTFFIDGQYTTYATTDGTPLAPGESRVMTAQGGGKGGKWTATAGAHVLRVFVDDIDRVTSERSKANNNIDRSLLVDVHTPGLLLGAADPAPGQVDLTAEGTEDWVHWGLGDKAGVNRKATGGSQIGPLTEVGSGYRDATSGFGMSAKWTDGAPMARMDDTHSSLWLNNVGYGYGFTAPADTQERVLRVYVGGIEGAGCTLTAHLSDGSAPDYVSKTFNGNLANSWSPVPDGFTGVYTIRYRAATAGQKLNITWTLTEEPNRFLGQARLQAATLAKR
ncbi:MAG: hypothetical protein M3Y56_11715 [Armatimonadota bacterium]|nr:hypothetical protein [Armatimonadota bacterium]